MADEFEMNTEEETPAAKGAAKGTKQKKNPALHQLIELITLFGGKRPEIGFGKEDNLLNAGCLATAFASLIHRSRPEFIHYENRGKTKTKGKGVRGTLYDDKWRDNSSSARIHFDFLTPEEWPILLWAWRMAQDEHYQAGTRFASAPLNRWLLDNGFKGDTLQEPHPDNRGNTRLIKALEQALVNIHPKGPEMFHECLDTLGDEGLGKLVIPELVLKQTQLPKIDPKRNKAGEIIETPVQSLYFWKLQGISSLPKEKQWVKVGIAAIPEKRSFALAAAGPGDILFVHPNASRGIESFAHKTLAAEGAHYDRENFYLPAVNNMIERIKNGLFDGIGDDKAKLP
jgi:hypothetical protein